MNIRAFDRSIREFYATLDETTLAKVLHKIDWLERFGNQLGMPHSKKITPNLFELRVRGGIEVRILYVFRNREVILLHPFIKKSQKTPPKEIEIARKKMKLLDDI